jgi:predicted O-methyltransferase YrrM
MWLLADRVVEVYREKGLIKLIKKMVLYAVGVFYALSYCIFAIKRVDDRFGPESLVDIAFKRYHGLLRPFQIQGEITELVTLVEKMRPETVLEIGTASGGTLFLFSRVASPNASIISVDLPGGIHGGGYPWWKTILYRSFASRKQKITLMRVDSHLDATLNDVKKMLGGRKVDFLFIDGDHTYNGVRKDFENYAPLVRKGGLIALHDIASDLDRLGCEVYKYWNETKPRYRHTEIVTTGGQTLYGIGVIFVE